MGFGFSFIIEEVILEMCLGKAGNNCMVGFVWIMSD